MGEVVVEICCGEESVPSLDTAIKRKDSQWWVIWKELMNSTCSSTDLTLLSLPLPLLLHLPLRNKSPLQLLPFLLHLVQMSQPLKLPPSKNTSPCLSPKQGLEWRLEDFVLGRQLVQMVCVQGCLETVLQNCVNLSTGSST